MAAGMLTLKIATTLLCVWFSMVIHELGHFAVVKLLGYKVVTISFGKLQEPMVRIAVCDANIYFTPYFWTGVTAFDPESYRITVIVYAAFLVAGSFANLLAVLAACLVRGSQDIKSMKDFFTFQKLPTFWALFIMMNLAYGIGELMPVWSSDGVRLLKLLQGRYMEVD